jgi:AcrR family transcriptional regulator
MRERADSTQATRQRILDAALEVGTDRWYDEVTLREIAAAAGVALQTVVNHFGTKEGVLIATIESGVGQALVMEGRRQAPVDDVDAAVHLLVEDYERIGDTVIRNLAIEGRIPAISPAVEVGRKEHRDWLRHVFPAALAGLHGGAYGQRLDLLVCATDVYTWKLLRRDRKLSRSQTEAAIAELVWRLHPDQEKGSR